MRGNKPVKKYQYNIEYRKMNTCSPQEKARIGLPGKAYHSKDFKS